MRCARWTRTTGVLFLLLTALPVRAGEEPDSQRPWLAGRNAIQVGSDGVARSLFQPEFRDAVSLRAQLLQLGVKDLQAELVTPYVGVPLKPGERTVKPPVLSRILLRGSEKAVRRGHAFLARLDAPQRAVFVSVLMSEVKDHGRLSTGGSLILDKGAEPQPDQTFFRGVDLQFEPEEYLRSTLTGATPFQGTSLRFADPTLSSGGAFEFTLRMLMSQGDAEFLAWPNLLCNEEHPGTMESLQDVPQPLLLSPRPLDNPLIAITSEQVGLKMRVTPLKIGSDSAVLDLDVWLRLPEEITDGTAPFGTLRLKLRQVRTRLTVRDREPLLVGGLRFAGRGRSRRGLPRPKQLALLDPLHSALFRDQADTEILFLVRARVIQPCRRPPELYPDGYQAWLKGRVPDGRLVRSPWVQVPQGARQMDEGRTAPFKR